MGKLFNIQLDVDRERETLPKKILEEQCSYLNEETKRIVIGRVAEYPGNIKIGPVYTSLITRGMYDGIDEQPLSAVKENIQGALGDVGEGQLTYEFFLTSKGTPGYKFRVMFMQYGITGYPVTIALEEGIANEINHSEDGFTYYVENKKEFEDVLIKIFNSKRFGEILRNLIQLNG